MARAQVVGAFLALLVSAGIITAVVLPAGRSEAQVTPGCAAAQASYNALQAAYLDLGTRLGDAQAAQSRTQTKVDGLIAEMQKDQNTVTDYKQLDSAVDDDVNTANNIIANDSNGIKEFKDQSLSTVQDATLKGLSRKLDAVVAQMDQVVTDLQAGNPTNARILVKEAAAGTAVALLKYADPLLDFVTVVDLENLIIPISKTLASVGILYPVIESDVNQLHEMQPAYDAAQAELTGQPNGQPSLQSVIDEGNAKVAAEGRTISNLTTEVNAAQARAQQANAAMTTACAPASSPSPTPPSPTASASAPGQA